MTSALGSEWNADRALLELVEGVDPLGGNSEREFERAVGLLTRFLHGSGNAENQGKDARRTREADGAVEIAAPEDGAFRLVGVLRARSAGRAVVGDAIESVKRVARRAGGDFVFVVPTCPAEGSEADKEGSDRRFGALNDARAVQVVEQFKVIKARLLRGGFGWRRDILAIAPRSTMLGSGKDIG